MIWKSENSWRSSIDHLCEALGLSSKTCKQFLTENPGMHQITINFVPCLLKEDEKQNWVQMCTELKTCYGVDPNLIANIFMDNTIHIRKWNKHWHSIAANMSRFLAISTGMTTVLFHSHTYRPNNYHPLRCLKFESAP